MSEGFVMAGNGRALALALVITVAIFAVVAIIVAVASRVAGRAKAAKALARPEAPTASSSYGGLFVGADNRLSTSKSTAVMWTAILVFLILGIVLYNWGYPATYNSQIQSIDTTYLIQLGGPFAAAILAKGIVSGAVNSGATQKPVADSPSPADLFSDDEGNTSLVDTQYLIFNLLAAVIVVGQFIAAPKTGAPTLPGFLVGLTSASAATYVANKAINVTKNPPAISMITPPTARPGSLIQVVGANFVVDAGIAPEVYIAGVGATVVGTPTATSIEAIVPTSTKPGSQAVTVKSGTVLTPDGTTVAVVADAITVDSLDASQKHAGDTLVIHGLGFIAPGDLTPKLHPVASATVASVTLQSVIAGVAPIPCTPARGSSPTDDRLAVEIPATPAGTYKLLLTRPGISHVAAQQITVVQ